MYGFDHRSQNGPWDMYSISDIPGDFVGANNIITNLTEETETGIKINLHRGVPRFFLGAHYFQANPMQGTSRWREDTH